MAEYNDTFERSDDDVYRWWYERRWGPGPRLCWVGLNPSTGDTTGRPRPTLRKVVQRARALGLDAVVVVNLFSLRVTDSKELRRRANDMDVIGWRTDEVIAKMSGGSEVTLAAWGAEGTLFERGAAVAKLLDHPLCLGTTRHGEPLHPLYVPSQTPARPYVR
jgi:hypothetical protein